MNDKLKSLFEISNSKNHLDTRGIARLHIDEGHMLYQYAKNIENGVILEIGRLFGGSTIIMGEAAKENNTKIISVDIVDNLPIDSVIWLNKLNVDIRVCDSWKMDCEPNDMLFIDGDHSYEAVKKDFTHHWNSLKDDGVCLAHDYGIKETYRCIGVTRFIDEWVNEGFAKVIDKTRSMIALQKIKNY